MLVGRNWEDSLRSFDACFASFNRGENAVFLRPISSFSAQLSVLLEVENAILPPLCFEVAKFSPCFSFGKENIGVAKDGCLLAEKQQVEERTGTAGILG